ncbi:MAG TPA: S41 family peptidase [Niastella sp.]
MKKYCIAILLCCLHIGAFTQSTEVKNYINEITSIIKSNSLVAGQINWTEYEKDVSELSKNINSIDSCKPVLNYIIKTLRVNGDKHSFFIGKQGADAIINGTALPEVAQGRLLNAHTGYIKVPSIVSFNEQVNNRYRDTIQQLIKKLDTENEITAWIVDLRHNTGGSMWPMVAGLNALIKDGVAGYWVNTNNKSEKWYSYGRSFMGKGNFYKVKRMSSPIAVLIDSFTASSGEMTAISFIGLHNVKTFGQPSAGYITSNYPYRLSNGAIFALAQAFAADRKKNIYKERIYPDVHIKENSKTADDTMAAALEWVTKESS